MKNLEIYGVQEMNAQEMIDVNGGGKKFWKALGKTALIIIVCVSVAATVV